MAQEYRSHQLEGGTLTLPERAKTEVHVMASIAVSLKRIADALSEQNEYGEGPAAAIGGSIRRGLQQHG